MGFYVDGSKLYMVLGEWVQKYLAYDEWKLDRSKGDTGISSSMYVVDLSDSTMKFSHVHEFEVSKQYTLYDFSYTLLCKNILYQMLLNNNNNKPYKRRLVWKQETQVIVDQMEGEELGGPRLYLYSYHCILSINTKMLLNGGFQIAPLDMTRLPMDKVINFGEENFHVGWVSMWMDQNCIWWWGNGLRNIQLMTSGNWTDQREIQGFHRACMWSISLIPLRSFPMFTSLKRRSLCPW